LDDTQKPGSHPNRVRELREDRLMTQAQLARKARVALRTIHSVEKGMNCRMDTKRKILLALGMRFDDKDQVFPPNRRGYAHSAGLASLGAFSAGARPGSEDNLS